MNKNIFIKLFIIVFISALAYSCVPSRQLEDAKAENQKCLSERNSLKKQNETLSTENNELNSLLRRLKSDYEALVSDTSLKGRQIRAIASQHDKANSLYEEMMANQEKLRLGADAESQKALSLLLETRSELQAKEDELRALEARLNQERANVESMKIQNELKGKEIEDKQKEIEDRNAKVAELQAILSAQDSVMNALKHKLSDALKGFEGDGLTVDMKDGNVYVSLDEKLLFKSGRWDVDPKGVQALKNLGQVLENNPDINIMIEGHTDDLAYGGNGNIQDNWDLSVKRATAIVKILLANSEIDPSRLTAAGRSSFIPIDDEKTAEARTKNRRTEIILTPKLDTLYDIVNQ